MGRYAVSGDGPFCSNPWLSYPQCMWKNPLTAKFVTSFGRILGTALILAAVSTLIESVAGVGGRSRLIDLTGVLIERPFWLIVFGVWAAWGVRRLFKATWPEAIERTLRLAPLVLIIPLINALVAWLGLESTVPAFVNVLEVPVSVLTFGWLPRLLASPGVLVFLIVWVISLAAQAWQTKQPIKQIVLAIIFWLAGSFGLLFLPSIFSWVVVSNSVSPLNAGPNVLARAWVALSQEGYWWRSIVERFPGMLEGEAEASVRLLLLSLAWLAAVILGCVWFFRQLQGGLKQVLGWLKSIRAVSFLGAAIFGLCIGQAFGGRVFTRAVDLVAFLLFFLTLLAVWGVSVWRNDVHDVGGDREAQRMDRPLVSGELSFESFAWLGKALAVIALVSGWLLGWPVLLPLLGFLLIQEGLHLPGLRWKERSFGGLLLALSLVLVVASGVFFALRTAAVPVLPVSIWLTVALFYLFQAFPKALRWSPNLLGWLATHLRLSPRLLIPIALALGYVLVPLLSGWTVLWWIALPCAVVALLPLLGNGRWDERKIVGWQTAFIIITFLLLAIHPSS